MDPQHSPEFALIAAILTDQSVMELHGDALEGEEFQNAMCQFIWRISKSLSAEGKVVDYTFIVSQYREKIESFGGLELLLTIYSGYYSGVLIEQYIDLIQEQHARRKLTKLGAKLLDRANNPDVTLSDLIGELETEALGIRPERGSIRQQKKGNAVLDWWADIENRYQHRGELSGIPSGWAELDRLTNGFQGEDLIVIGGRTSVGKSAVSINIMLNATIRGFKPAMFSLEMSKNQVFSRAAASLGNIDLHRLRTGNLEDDDWAKMSLALVELEKMRVIDDRGLTTDEIVTEIRRMKHKDGIDLVIVDYAQIVNEPHQNGDNGGTRVARVALKLRAVAQQAKIPIILLSQISRNVESRQNKRPLMSDLGESGGLENAADAVILLYRDDYYDPETDKKNILELQVAKQRNGATGLVELVYLKNYQKLISLERMGEKSC